MSAQPDLSTVRVERVLPAPPERAYDAWLSEGSLREFICPAPGRASEVSVDPRPGGSLRIVMSMPDYEREITGRFIALDRPERISFTWRTDIEDHESVVTVLFAPHGDRETQMTILHSRQWVTLVDSYRSGWTSIADGLAGYLAGTA